MVYSLKGFQETSPSGSSSSSPGIGRGMGCREQKNCWETVTTMEGSPSLGLGEQGKYVNESWALAGQVQEVPGLTINTAGY